MTTSVGLVCWHAVPATRATRADGCRGRSRSDRGRAARSRARPCPRAWPLGSRRGGRRRRRRAATPESSSRTGALATVVGPSSSCFPWAQRALDAVGEGRVLTPRPAELGKPRALDHEVALRSAAALGYRITRVRADEALALEAIERRVDGAGRDPAARAVVDFVANRRAVGTLSQSEKGEQDQELELTEAVSGWHMNYSIRDIDAHRPYTVRHQAPGTS